MTVVPFTLQASVGCPAHASLVLALAAEFRTVDADAVERDLDALAVELESARDGDAIEQLEAVETLARCFETRSSGVDLEDLFLDVVVDRFRGHPALVACVLADCARRAGLSLGVVGEGLVLMLAHTGEEHGVVFDVAGRSLRALREEEPGRLRWRCSHQVAFAVLRDVIDRALLAGDVTTALRATDLRLALPIDAEMRGRLRDERAGLLAKLN